MNPILSTAELNELIQKAIDAELWEPDKRRLLFFRMADLRGKMPTAASHVNQLRTDLQFLYASAPRDSVAPLLIWLQNARPLVADYPMQDYFEALLARLEERPRGSGTDLTGPTLRAALNKEAILIQDDMLPIGYLRAGMEAARSVARLRVPQYNNGQAQGAAYWGTGWLVTKTLLITNHHVFNARDEDDPTIATPSDFRLQAVNTTLEFDLDSNNAAGNSVIIVDVVASDPNLDFAIVRIQTAGERAPIPVQWSPFRLNPRDVVPLNIIQHPNGQPKMIAIRNNLAIAAPSPELRYFTSTLGGSSGSPVMSDNWRAVGIHRGSIGTKVLSFQGHTTAIINVGTQMAAILAAVPDSLKTEVQTA